MPPKYPQFLVFCAGVPGTSTRPAPGGSHPGASIHIYGEQLLNVSPLRTRPKEPDQACADADAQALARAAAVALAGADRVGDYLGAEPEGERLVTHLFTCLDPAYHGWRWAVTVTRASRSKTVTISECLLLPGPDSVLAPPWVPWRERLRPGDLGVGDILPAAADDERLVPVAALEGDDGVGDWGEAGWAAAGLKPPGGAEDEDEDEDGEAGPEGGAGEAAGEAAGAGGEAAQGGQPPAREEPRSRVGGRRRRPRRTAAGEPAAGWDTAPGRVRVLSAIGRDDAAFRWYTSEHGPQSPLANAAPGPCTSCGFFVHLAGPLGRVFGVCANEYAPDDGRVVSLDHGCGAHSEGPLLPGMESPLPPVIDELGYDLVDVQGVSVDDTDFEPID